MHKLTDMYKCSARERVVSENQDLVRISEGPSNLNFHLYTSSLVRNPSVQLCIEVARFLSSASFLLYRSELDVEIPSGSHVGLS